MATPAFSWGVPGVYLPPPPTTHPVPTTPLPWTELKFNPLGLYDLRRHLGVHFANAARFNLSCAQFLASDLAFLAAGASDDGKHAAPAASVFFPEFDELYDSLPVGETGKIARKEFGENIRRLLWDLATKWDRSTGSTTMILHVDGTSIPGAPLEPDLLKANCYLPPHFLAENVDSHRTIAFIVQTFIEQIGIPTVAAWTRRAKSKWSMRQVGHVPKRAPPTELIPTPSTPRSAHYIFYGRPWGSISLLPTTSSTAAPAPSHSTPGNDEDTVYDIDKLTLDDTLTEALARINQLEHENTGLREALDALDSLQQTVAADFSAMTADVSRLESELRLARATRIPATSLQLHRSIPMMPTTPRRPETPQPTHIAPPAYIPASSTASPWRGVRSPREESAGNNLWPHTEEFLRAHSLAGLTDSLNLIVRAVSVVRWGIELGRLSDLPSDLVDGLLEVMILDNDGSV